MDSAVADPLPLVTSALVDRIDRATAAFTLGWLEGDAQRPGNPGGIEVRRFGSATATVSTGAPDLDFRNTVYGLRDDDARLLPEVLAFYRARGVRPWFELAPLPGFESLAAALTAAGAAQFGVHGAFYGRPSGGSIAAPSAPGVEVRPVAPGDIDRFGETLLRGFGVPEFVLRQEVETVRHWTDLSGWFLLEANVDGEPAGGAVLTVADGVAYLAYASTLPAFRGRGVQSALLAERLRLAAEAGCDLVVSLAEFDSPSARNLQRVGLRLAYLLSRWRLGGADEPPPTDRAKEPSREEVGP